MYVTLQADISLLVGQAKPQQPTAHFGTFARHTKPDTEANLAKEPKFPHSTNIHQQDPSLFAKFVRMTQAINFQPLDNELPSHFADRLGLLYAGTVTTQHKKDNGQFFTPTEIAHFMSGLVKQSKNKLKILDPGCGTAILSSSLIETLIQKSNTLKEIELVVYETDKDILPYTQATLNYLKTWLQKKEC